MKKALILAPIHSRKVIDSSWYNLDHRPRLMLSLLTEGRECEGRKGRGMRENGKVKVGESRKGRVMEE